MELALAWACWKTYLGLPVAREQTPAVAMGILGCVLSWPRPGEALPILESTLALYRRFYRPARPGDGENKILSIKAGMVTCLSGIGRRDEALVLQREVFAGYVAAMGVLYKTTISNGNQLAEMLNVMERWDEAIALSRELLPAARQSLGADHEITLFINQNLVYALERTRDDLRLNQRPSRRGPFSITTQATTCSKPRPSCGTCSSDGDGSSALRIRRRDGRIRVSCGFWKCVSRSSQKGSF